MHLPRRDRLCVSAPPTLAHSREGLDQAVRAPSGSVVTIGAHGGLLAVGGAIETVTPRAVTVA